MSKSEISSEEELIALQRENVTLRNELETMRNWFRSMDHVAPFEFWFKDIDSRYLLVNAEFENAIGITRDGLLGNTPFDIFPEDRAKRLIEVDERVMSLPDPLRRIVPCDQSGIERTFDEVRFPVINAKKDVVGLGCISFEITGQSKLEETFQAAQTIAGIASWRWCIKMQSLLSNSDSLVDMLGVARNQIHATFEDRINKTVHPKDIEKVSHVLEVASRSGNRYEVEYRMLMPSGEIKYIYEIGEIFLDTYGKPSEHIGSIQDITERYESRTKLLEALDNASRAEIKAQESARLAKVANESKSKFVASMSHELRTPLNAIIGFSEMLMTGSGFVKADQDNYHRIIHSSGQHLLSLINDILDLSKLEANKFEALPTTFMIHDCLNDSIMLNGPLISQKEICLKVSCEETEIFSDERMVKQILVNLLSNAAKFTPVGGSISVTGQCIAGNYQIMFNDTGCGLSKEDILLVQQPFVQVRGDGQNTDGAGGTGLGLPLVKQFAEVLGGEFIFESKIGIGTQAGISIPSQIA